LTEVNFTKCQCSSYGSALRGGASVIDSFLKVSSPRPSILNSFFYNNLAYVALLNGRLHGMTVTDCFFVGMSKMFLTFKPLLTAVKFKVTGCFFSGALPDSSWVSGSGNLGNTVITTNPNAEAKAMTCTYPPPSSPFVQSETLAPSKAFFDSHTFVISAPTAVFLRSWTAPVSAANTKSIPFSVSRNTFVDSRTFLVSAPTAVFLQSWTAPASAAHEYSIQFSVSGNAVIDSRTLALSSAFMFSSPFRFSSPVTLSSEFGLPSEPGLPSEFGLSSASVSSALPETDFARISGSFVASIAFAVSRNVFFDSATLVVSLGFAQTRNAIFDSLAPALPPGSQGKGEHDTAWIVIVAVAGSGVLLVVIIAILVARYFTRRRFQFYSSNTITDDSSNGWDGPRVDDLSWGTAAQDAVLDGE
jgi:hypothetical protein